MFDLNNNGYLDATEFVNGMKTLFTESYENFVKFIFDFYDFDKDGKISREDMQLVLSFIPLNNTKERLSGYKLKFENVNYSERIESQDEIHDILNKCFNTTNTLDKNQYIYIIENVASETFLFVIIAIKD